MIIRTVHNARSGLRHDLRIQDVTASQVAALYGCGFHTPLALWHSKLTGEPIQVDDSEAMARGRWLENAVGDMARERIGHEFEIAKADAYYRVRSDTNEDLRLGATPDFDLRHRVSGALSVLEGKTTDEAGYYEHWDGDRIPLHYALQGLVQMICMDLREMYFGVLVFTRRGCQGHIRRLEYNAEAARDLCERVIRFWRSVRTGERPAPVYGSDSAVLDRLTQPRGAKLGRAEAGEELWGEVDQLATEIISRRESVKQLNEETEQRRDRLREIMQDYTTCQTTEATISYKANGKKKRTLRINRRTSI